MVKYTAEFESKLRRYMAARGIGLGPNPRASRDELGGLRGKGLGISQPQSTNNDQLWGSQ